MRVHGSPLWVAEVTRPPAGIYVLRSLEGRVIGRWDGAGWEASLAESVPLESLIDFGAPSVGDILALATWADAVESSGLGLDENLLTAVVAAHTRGVPGVAERAGAIRLAAAAWVEFWDGRLDLEALAWETAEHLRDITIASEQIERATTQAQRYWAGLYGDDPLGTDLVRPSSWLPPFRCDAKSRPEHDERGGDWRTSTSMDVTRICRWSQ